MNILYLFRALIIFLIGGGSTMNHPQSLSDYTPTWEERVNNKVAEYKAPLLLICIAILLVLIVALVVVIVPPMESGLYYNHFLEGNL